MPALLPPNPGGWGVGDEVTSTQMNIINSELPKAPNWVDGGAVYNPLDQIELGGAGLRFTTTTEFADTSVTTFDANSTVNLFGDQTVGFTGSIVVEEDGQIVAESGSVTTFESGSVVSVAGVATVASGGRIDVASGGLIQANSGAEIELNSGSVLTVESGGDIVVDTGGAITSEGQITFADGTWPLLSPARSWARSTLRIMSTSYSAAESNNVATDDGVSSLDAPQFPNAWIGTLAGGGGTNIPFIHTRSSGDTGSEPTWSWLALDDLPHGSTFTDVEVISEGEGSETTLTLPTYRIARQLKDGSISYLSDETTDAHSTSDYKDEVETTTITVNAFSIIDRNYRYFVVMEHPSSPAGSSVRIRDVTASGTASTLITSG